MKVQGVESAEGNRPCSPLEQPLHPVRVCPCSRQSLIPEPGSSSYGVRRACGSGPCWLRSREETLETLPEEAGARRGLTPGLTAAGIQA